MKILFFLFALSTTAHADILFLDLNNSPKEIQAAREAAKKSKRQLYVFPNNTPEQLKAYKKVAEEVTALERKFNKSCKNIENQDCDKIIATLKENREKEQKIVEPMRFNPDKLKEFLAQREAEKNPISSMVISGHDGTGHFAGKFGGIDDKVLASLFDEFPLTKGSVRSLHLWGCYTTSPSSLMLNWTKNFPSAALISGYEGRAPLNDKPPGWHYLKAVLGAEPELLKITDNKKLRKALRSLPGAIDTASAMLVCDYYASIKESYDLSELPGRCAALKIEVAKHADEYNCYLRADQDKCANPPTNTSAGPVRKFYELLQKISACVEIFPADPEYREFNRDQAIRLVFAQEVQNNFSRIYKKEIQESDQMLAELGAPNNLRFSGLEKLSRKEMLERAQGLLAFIQANTPDASTDPASLEFGEREAKILSLTRFQQFLTDTMGNLSHRCVPFNWTEPNESDLSQCASQKYLGISGVVETLAAKNNYVQNRYGQMIAELRVRIEKEGENAETDAVAKAQAALWRASLARLLDYKTYAEKGVPAQNLLQLNRRVQWSETVLSLAKAGVKVPALDPSALKITWDYNSVMIQQAKNAAEKRLKTLNDTAAKSADEVTKRRARDLAKEAENDVLIQDLLQEGIEILRSGQTEKQERLVVIKKELGELLTGVKLKRLQRSLDSAEAAIKRIMSQPAYSETDLQTAVTARDDSKVEVERFLSNQENLAKGFVEEELMLPRFLGWEDAKNTWLN